MEHLIFYEEIGYHGVPFLGFGPTMIGPTLVRCGREAEEAKRKYLPKIAKAEVSFCVGYTEPGAGTDLASLQTRAIEDGDDYIISGQKVFTTDANRADLCWLGARTDPDAPKHKGISVFIADMKAPGITVRPLGSIDDPPGGSHLNEVFLDEVRVPKENLVGEKNRGWYYITSLLDFERLFLGGGFYSWGGARRILDNKIIPYYEASMTKVFGTELNQRLASVGMQVLGLYGPLVKGSKWAFLQGQIGALSLLTIAETIGGGASEVQRDLIANVGLGLPRVRPTS